MLKNYIKIALRNITRQKAYSLINISGLAIGIAACILILLFVKDELSFDRYHENADRIYRVSREWLNQNGETNLHLGHVAPPFAPLLENDFKGIIDYAVRFQSGYDPLIRGNGKEIQESRFFFADKDVFNVFTWKMIEGDPKTALAEPNSVVLTKTTAEKYFGTTEALGKQISYNNFGQAIEMKVTGVMEDVPLNSHFKFDFLGSFATLENVLGRDNLMQSWGSNNYATYLLLNKNATARELEAQLPGFIDKHMSPNPDGSKRSMTNRLHLWPLTSIHLHSHLDSEVEPNGDIAYVYIYSIIAIFILLIACINFMNLSTARSAKRAQEVGLRKVLGAYRSALIRQFILESVIFSLLGLAFALIIVLAVLPSFNDFVQKQLTLNISEDGFVGLLLIAITVIVGIIAGSYPAFFLSSFQPATILKGSHRKLGKKINLRSILVVFQFCISIVLIIGVGVVQDQLNYMRKKDLGFKSNDVLVLPSSNLIYSTFESVKQRLEANPSIEQVTLASRVPSGRLLDSQGGQVEVGGEMKDIEFRVADVHVDHDYLRLLGIPMAAGRDFDRSRASDSTHAFIINNATARQLGWDDPEEAIGRKFNYGGRTGEIIGVTKDFHFESLHQPIVPIVFMITTGRNSSVVVRVKKGREEEAQAFLQDQWKFLRPGFPFSSFFIDDNFSQQYGNEDRLHLVVEYFSILAVFIAALGLFGLASYTAEQRIKEIGIRKVMGASVSQILILLTSGFTRLVIVAFIIAIPVSWYGMDKWLDNFAYRGEMHLTSFLMGGMMALIIAWITVISQTLSAALTNPVNSIRYE